MCIRDSWRVDLVERPDQLAGEVVALLGDLRLMETGVDQLGGSVVRLLPAAARFRAVDERPPERPQQPQLL